MSKVPQEITVIVIVDGESHTFQMNPEGFLLEEHQEIETLRFTSGEVLEMKKIGLPSLRIQGTYQGINGTRTDSSSG